jgi:hypothetical protein
MKKRKAKTLYEKRGNKFIPVGKDDFILPYSVGDYLIRVRNGHNDIKWCKKGITIDWAKVEIILDEAADAIMKALREASKLERNPLPMSAREKKAWKAYVAILGEERLMMSRKSTCDIAHNAVKCLRENLKGKSECPEGCLEVYAER